VPSLIKGDLGLRSHAIDGAVVFELYVFAIATVLLWRNLESRAAMVRGLAVLLPTLGLLVLTREVQSLPVLLCDSALAGVAVAFGYRGSLQVVNEIAPAEARAEILSSYFVAAFAGAAMPVIGVALLSRWLNETLAHIIFAATIGAFAILALVIGARNGGAAAVKPVRTPG
jgi:MFS family permease